MSAIPKCRTLAADFALAGVGGAIGTLLRCATGNIVSPNAIAAILLCNIAGSFVFALFAFSKERIGRKYKILINTGLCGGLTTFSTFSVQTAMLLKSGHVPQAAALFTGTFALCLCAAAAAGALLKQRGKRTK